MMYRRMQYMNRLQEQYQLLKSSVAQGFRDHSLVAQLTPIPTPAPDDCLQYAKILIGLYDLSHHPTLLTRQIDPMHLKIKSVCLEMLVTLVRIFSNTTHIPLPPQLVISCMEIMIIIERLLIDSEHSANLSTQSHTLCTKLYHHCQSNLSSQYKLIHQLNSLDLIRYCLDLIRYCPDEALLRHSPLSIQTILAKFMEITRQTVTECNLSEYMEYMRVSTMQIVLRAIRKGRDDFTAPLLPYLSPEHAQLVSRLDNPTINIAPTNSNVFYSLYCQISLHGMKNISEEYLRMLIEKQAHFNDKRIFDLCAMTLSLLPLQIWFSVHHSKKHQTLHLVLAYQCYTYLIDHLLCKEGNKPIPSEEASNGIPGILELSKSVMLSLLKERKDILSVIKRLMNILIYCVSRNCATSTSLKDYTDKLTLVLTRHSDLQRVLSSLTLYHLLRNSNEQQVLREAYQKFTKLNPQKNACELVKTLRLAYALRQAENISQREENRLLLRRQPYLAVLFGSKHNYNIILDFDLHQFAGYDNKFKIYWVCINGCLNGTIDNGCPNGTIDNGCPNGTIENDSLQINEADFKECERILIHLHEILCLAEYEAIGQLDQAYAIKIRNIFLELLNQESLRRNCQFACQLSTVALNLFCFSSLDLLKMDYGLPLNKYSRLQKLLQYFSENQFPTQIPYLCKMILTSSLQRYKSDAKQMLPGEMIFLEQAVCFSLHQQSSLPRKHYIRFIDFELHAIANCLDESIYIYEDDLSLLRMYCSSVHIPRRLKVKLLRKLITQDICSESGLVSFGEYQQLLGLTDNIQEKAIYVRQIIRNFGEAGRKFLEALAADSPQQYSFLHQDF